MSWVKAGMLPGHSSTRRSRQVPSFLGHLATNQTDVLLTGTLTSNHVTAFLIPFLSI